VWFCWLSGRGSSSPGRSAWPGWRAGASGSSASLNLLGILGAAGLLHPVPVSAVLLRSDMVWMLLTAGMLLPLLVTGQRVSRREGGLLVAVYLAYIMMLLLR